MINEVHNQLIIGTGIVAFGCLTVTSLADACEKYMQDEGWYVYRSNGSIRRFKGEIWGFVAKRWTQFIGLVMIIIGCTLVCQVAFR